VASERGFACPRACAFGALSEAIDAAISRDDLVVASVLSGNRHFEARSTRPSRSTYLMSPPLGVAFSLAGPARYRFFDRAARPLRRGSRRLPMADGVPSPTEIQRC